MPPEPQPAAPANQGREPDWFRYSQAEIQRCITGALRQMGAPPFPFLEEVTLLLIHFGDSLEIRMRFANGLQTAFHIPLREIHRSRGWVDRGMDSEILTRRIAETYFVMGQQAAPHAVVADPVRVEPFRYHGLEGTAEHYEMRTISWEQAARRYWDQRRERDRPMTTAQPAPNPYTDIFRQPQELEAMHRHAEMSALAQQRLNDQFRRLQQQMYVQAFGNPPWATTRDRLEAETQRSREFAEQRLKARVRGRKLLLENLTPTQRQSYETHGYFDVIGGESGKTYRIYHGTHMNIERLGGLMNQNGICVVPVGNLCYGDVMLSQKLAIELEENKMLREANLFRWGPADIDLIRANARNGMQNATQEALTHG